MNPDEGDEELDPLHPPQPKREYYVKADAADASASKRPQLSGIDPPPIQ